MKGEVNERVVGLVGIGLVGAALAEVLLADAYTVVGFDIERSRCDHLRDMGGRPTTNIPDVAEACSTVLLSLPDSVVVGEVVEGSEGLLSGHWPPRWIVDTTTGDPEEVTSLAQRLAERGVAYLDCTLSGSSTQVRRREAVAMVGGDATAFAEVRDLLASIATRVFHLGGPGAGSRAKLATNVLIGLHRAALAESMAFAEALGLDLGTFLALVRTSPAYSVAADAKGPKMLNGDFVPESRIVQHRKDVALILRRAQELGQAMPLTTAHAELLDRAIAAGDGALDNAAIIKEFRRRRR